MRIEVEIRNKYPNQACIIPIDYQYYFASAIYKILKAGKPEFANLLHQKGYSFNNTAFKFFSFSPLRFTKGDYEIIKPDRFLFKERSLYFTFSYLMPEFTYAFIKGLFKNREITIEDKFSKAFFRVVQNLERYEEPKYTKKMSYKAVSPVLVTKRDNEFKHKDISPTNEHYKHQILKNLIKKYQTYSNFSDIPKKEYNISDLDIKISPKDQRSKLKTLNPLTKQETKWVGWLYNFELTAPEEIQKIAYYAGIGKENSMGFGYIVEDKK